MASESPIEAIQDVANHLGKLLDEVVFIGGAVASLLITDPAAAYVRPTEDVDIVTRVTSRREYYRLEAALRNLGLRNDTSPDAPICRWVTAHGTTVDIMPIDVDILGFTNRWYDFAVASSEAYRIPSGIEIRLVSAPAFIATKLEAYHARGTKDYVASHDIEDVMLVIDGRPSITGEIEEAPISVRTFIANSMSELLKDEDFLYALEGFIPYSPVARDRARYLESCLRKLARVK